MSVPSGLYKIKICHLYVLLGSRETKKRIIAASALGMHYLLVTPNYYTSGSQSVVPRSAASVSSRNMSEMHS